MAPKKGKKGKAAEAAEPEHDPDWEKSVESGVWSRPVTGLPDANAWPTWGALRERILTACKEITVTQSPSVRDAFAAEVVKLSPPLLTKLNLRGSEALNNVVRSPPAACPALKSLDLSFCKSLEYVLIQSTSLTELRLHNCGALGKALIHCPNLTTLTLSACPALATCMIWSGELTVLNMTGCNALECLKLHTPKLLFDGTVLPDVKVVPEVVKPAHPPLALMLKDNCREMAVHEAEAVEAAWKMPADGAIIPMVHRPI